MSPGRIVLLIFGVIFLVAAIFLMLAGGAVLWANAAMTDSEGFLESTTTRLESETYALVTEPADVDWDSGCWGPWCYDPGEYVTFKIEGENDDPARGIFIGIGAETDVQEYLEDVPHDQIVEWTPVAGSDEIDYRRRGGNSAPANPVDQDFWSASAYGTGTQTLVWEPEEGDWVLVIMNQDGSAGIDVSGNAGAKVPGIFWIGVGLLIAGAVILVLGIIMVFFAAREPRMRA